MFTEMMFYILVPLMFISTINTAFAEAPIACKHSEEDYFRSELIKIMDFTCDENEGCGLVVSFPKTYQDTSFVGAGLIQGDNDNLDLLVTLRTDEKEKTLESAIYGNKSFLENFRIHATYERINGCAYWAEQDLKHNKKRNELDGSDEPPIR